LGRLLLREDNGSKALAGKPKPAKGYPRRRGATKRVSPGLAAGFFPAPAIFSRESNAKGTSGTTHRPNGLEKSNKSTGPLVKTQPQTKFNRKTVRFSSMSRAKVRYPDSLLGDLNLIQAFPIGFPFFSILATYKQANTIAILGNGNR